MQTLYLIASFNAVFFALLLFHKKPKALHDKVLFWWLFYLAVFTSVYAFTREFIFTEYPILSASLISLLLLHGPFLFLYIRPLSISISRFRKKEMLHFLPFIIFNLYLLLAGFTPSLTEGISFVHSQHPEDSSVLFNMFLLFTGLSGPIYFVLSLRMLKNAENNLQENYSFSKQIDPQWLRRLVVIFGIIWTVLTCVGVIHHILGYFSLFFCTDGLSLSLSAFIILTGYFGLQQKAIFTANSTEVLSIKNERQKYSSTGIGKTDVEKLAKRLEQHMTVQTPYLDPELTLAGLASQLGIPSHHLSRAINEFFNTNFFDFINKYRIEEVKNRIINPQYSHLSILGIAFDCGFNSKSAFNRLFKKYTGITPSEYKSAVTRLKKTELTSV